MSSFDQVPKHHCGNEFRWFRQYGSRIRDISETLITDAAVWKNNVLASRCARHATKRWMMKKRTQYQERMMETSSCCNLLFQSNCLIYSLPQHGDKCVCQALQQDGKRCSNSLRREYLFLQLPLHTLGTRQHHALVVLKTTWFNCVASDQLLIVDVLFMCVWSMGRDRWGWSNRKVSTNDEDTCKRQVMSLPYCSVAAPKGWQQRANHTTWAMVLCLGCFATLCSMMMCPACESLHSMLTYARSRANACSAAHHWLALDWKVMSTFWRSRLWVKGHFFWE